MTEDRVILVTGASSGIGEATAHLFGGRGYRVVLAARRAERLQAVAQAIREIGGTALPLVTDLSQPARIRAMVQSALDHFGRIDVLFNNAGAISLGWLENLDPEAVEAQFRVNVLGAIYTAQAVLPHMIQRRTGHIINMISLAGLLAAPTYSVYASSKFALRGFTEALRREVSVWGINVSGVYPGGVRTDFVRKSGYRRVTRATTPAPLVLRPEEVAVAVFRLANRPRRGIILPWPMRFVVWANVLFPGLLDYLIERRFLRPERGLD